MTLYPLSYPCVTHYCSKPFKGYTLSTQATGISPSLISRRTKLSHSFLLKKTGYKTQVLYRVIYNDQERNPPPSQTPETQTTHSTTLHFQIYPSSSSYQYENLTHPSIIQTEYKMPLSRLITRKCTSPPQTTDPRQASCITQRLHCTVLLSVSIAFTTFCIFP